MSDPKSSPSNHARGGEPAAATASRPQHFRQLDEASQLQIISPGRRRRVRGRRDILIRPRRMRRPESTPGRMIDVPPTARHHHDLGWFQHQQLGRAIIKLRHRLLGADKIRAENCIPRQAADLVHPENRQDRRAEERDEPGDGEEDEKGEVEVAK